MTSAAKHAYRSHRNHFHYHRNYQDKPSKALNIDAIATAMMRRPVWFWSIINYIGRTYYDFRKRYRG